jgi:hypothetical protein
MPRVAFLVPYPGKLFRNNKNQENNLKLGLKVTSKALTPPCGVLLAFLMNIVLISEFIHYSRGSTFFQFFSESDYEKKAIFPCREYSLFSLLLIRPVYDLAAR